MRATTPGGSPASTSWTARLRRRSSSAAPPRGLILSFYAPPKSVFVFTHAVVCNPAVAFSAANNQVPGQTPERNLSLATLSERLPAIGRNWQLVAGKTGDLRV